MMNDQTPRDPALAGRRLIDEAREGVALTEAIVHALVLNEGQTSNLRGDPRLAAMLRQLGEQVEDHNRGLLDFLPAPAFVQLDGTFASVNALHVNLLGGNDRNDFIGEPVLRFVHPSSREAFKELTRELERDARPLISSEEKWLCVGGDEVDVRLLASATTYRGKPATRVILLRENRSRSNLTSLSRWIADFLAERRVRLQHGDALDALLHSPALAICIVDANGHCTFANDTGRRLLGCNPEHLPFTIDDGTMIVTPVRRDGTVAEKIVTFVDHTRAAAEERARTQVARMEAIAGFAARVAAELRSAGDADLAARVAAVAGEAPQLKQLELTHWLRGAAFWIREELDADHDITTAVPPQRVFVRADAKQLARAFAHLARFAHADVHVALSTGEQLADVTFRIAAPCANAEQLFESDLALAAVYEIVRRHGGRAWAESDASLTTIHLPLPMTVPDVVADLLLHVVRRGPMKVLIVEDETLVAGRLASDYRNVEVGIVNRIDDASETIERFAPDLVLISGSRVAVEGASALRALAERWPELPFVCSEPAPAERVDEMNVSQLPYDLDTLLGGVEKIAAG